MPSPHPMKKLIVGAVLAGLPSTILSDPLINSWFTDCSGVYARAYEDTAEEAAQNPGTTWDHPVEGRSEQLVPTYCGVHEISYTATHLYIRTTGLGSHVMGPWYGNAAKTNIFANFPSNMAVLYEFARTPGTPPVTKTLTGLGAIGYFVDGVAMFDSRDAFSYDNSAGEDERPNSGAGVVGDGIWNRDAYVNESVTFDPANAHQAGPQYHYHANPPGLRHLLGDSVDYDAATNTYTENFNGRHSPIIGWVRDSYPVYGPYGYDDPNDAGSGVRRMISGYQQRDGTNGSANIPGAGRTSLPQWAATVQGIGPGLAAGEQGPGVDASYPLGHYIEDYAYKGDLGMTLGVDFDLDLHNGRFCVTPEFPGGTYAYFCAIETDGTPVYPYNIGRTYYGNPDGQAVGNVPAGATLHFRGGPDAPDRPKTMSIDDASGDVTMVWSAVEGGKYDVQVTGTMGSFVSLPDSIVAGQDLRIVDQGRANADDSHFYRAGRLSVSPFDDTGFDYAGSTVVFMATFPTSPALPLFHEITSVTVGGVTATILSYNQTTGVVELDFDDSSLAAGNYNAVINGTFSSSNQYEVAPPATDPNILIMIVDDWGIDASPIDNTVGPAGVLPNMPNLQSLASSGLRFTRAYVNPTCSPTRSSIMTGRYAHQTGVYTPQDAGSFSTAELALPEAFTAAGSPYSMASMGKWHLGGNDSAYSARGGWDEFYGIQGGGVPNQADGYSNWTKNTNGTTANTTVYSTTDQVNEAAAFINRSETAGDPWFCWVAFNAPHTPFHEPPASLEPTSGGGYTNVGLTDNLSLYMRMLEALDTEIGRLLASVPADTNIILIGDNGTPNQTVQAPFGNGNSKGDLYNGGIHVPMVAKGPILDAALVGTTTDKLVHAVDLFSTLLELGGISASSVPGMPATALAQSTSIVPILTNTDTADRCVIAEGNAGAARGRAIITDDYPDYKMIIFGDPESIFDTPTIEFYHISSDINEQAPVYSGPVTATPGLSGTDQLAYTACLAKDAALGGGFSDPPTGVSDTLYIELPNPGSPVPVPNLTRPDTTPINVTSCTVTGASGTVTATVVGRLDWGTDLADESDDAAARYWVKVTVPQDPPYTTAHVVFPNRPTDGATREYDSINILVKP